MATSAKKPAYRAVSVYNRNGKDVFANVGAAWASAKGGFVLRLTAHPVGDTVLLRPFVEKAKAKA
jgi:hypothetical protein